MFLIKINNYLIFVIGIFCYRQLSYFCRVKITSIKIFFFSQKTIFYIFWVSFLRFSIRFHYIIQLFFSHAVKMYFYVSQLVSTRSRTTDFACLSYPSYLPIKQNAHHQKNTVFTSFLFSSSVQFIKSPIEYSSLKKVCINFNSLEMQSIKILGVDNYSQNYEIICAYVALT